MNKCLICHIIKQHSHKVNSLFNVLFSLLLYIIWLSYTSKQSTCITLDTAEWIRQNAPVICWWWRSAITFWSYLICPYLPFTGINIQLSLELRLLEVTALHRKMLKCCYYDEFQRESLYNCIMVSWSYQYIISSSIQTNGCFIVHYYSHE